jgi:hypothetical protein
MPVPPGTCLCGVVEYEITDPLIEKGGSFLSATLARAFAQRRDIPELPERANTRRSARSS